MDKRFCVIHWAVLARKVFGQNKDQRQFHKLGRLDCVSPQCIQPGFHAGGTVEDCCDRKQNKGCPVKHFSAPAEQFVGKCHNDTDYQGSQKDKQALFGSLV